MLFVDTAHESGRRRQNLVDKDKDRLLGGQLNPLTDHVDELPNGKVGRDKILLLVDGSDVRFLDLFADYL